MAGKCLTESLRLPYNLQFRYLLWHAALKEIRFFRELLGIKKPVDAVKKAKAEEEMKRIRQAMRR